MRTRWQIEPMPRWTFPTVAVRVPHRFQAGWDATLELLDRELDHLGVRGTVAVRVVARSADVRRDGMLRSNAILGHPGVALSFDSAKGPMTVPCDTYGSSSGRMPAWQANVRAIALSLESLRAVDRHGVSTRGQQYQGWREIGAGLGTSAPAFPSTEAAERFLRHLVREHAGAGPAHGEDIRQVLRRARVLTHPDRPGGDRARWDRVQAAAELLGLGKAGAG